MNEINNKKIDLLIYKKDKYTYGNINFDNET